MNSVNRARRMWTKDEDETLRRIAEAQAASMLNRATCRKVPDCSRSLRWNYQGLVLDLKSASWKKQ